MKKIDWPKVHRLIVLAGMLVAAAACSRPTPLTPEATTLLSQLESEGSLISAKKIAGEIPSDPSATLWNEATETNISLVSQTSVVPRAPEFRRSRLSVRAVYNKKEIGLLLSWDDPTQDTSEAGTEHFRDAVAIGFPLDYGDGLPLPYIGMGNSGRPMNFWHWKASWEADLAGYRGIAERFPGGARDEEVIKNLTGEQAGNPLSNHQRKGPVENLLAEGFGTLTSVADDRLTGKGIWENGHWKVVVRRKLSTGKAQGVTIDRRKGGLPISFAIWDGATAERNGMKGLSRWRYLRLEGENPTAGALEPLAWRPSSSAKRGRQLVTDLGCIQCHNLPDSPATRDVGPDLTHVGAMHLASYLMESVKNPNAVVVPAPGYFDPETGTSTMPSYEGALQEQDYHDVVEYLRSLQ